MIHKDLLSEWRARQAWPVMLLLGVVVAVVFSLQMDLPRAQKQQLVGGMLWLAILFAGMIAVGRSFTSEREENCWEGLLLYPTSRSTIYLAKLTVNVVALAILQCVLIPLFVVLCNTPLLGHPGAMLLVAVLGNLGIAAIGTLLAALAADVRNNRNLLELLIVPIAIPVVLAAAEATRLQLEGNIDAQWWRAVQLLGAFAIVFVVVGIVLFDIAVEE
jgi:heme exporter protein B